MKPSELYALEPVRTSFDASVFFGCYFNHIPELKEGQKRWWGEPIKGNTRIEIRYYADHNYDGRRIWRLASAWFDGKPFIIIRNAGREGDDHASRFVTDVEIYKDAVVYLKRLLLPAFNEVKDVVDPNTEIPDLTEFYGYDLQTAANRW